MARNRVDASTKTYYEQDGCTYWSRQTREGVMPVCLAKFTAQVVEELELDDGSGRTTLSFVIEGKSYDGSELPRIIVPASEFEGMKWTTQRWGFRALIHAGQGTREHMRAAIQTMSHTPARRRIFQHLGWTKYNGSWIFCHAGGGLGPTGAVEGVEVDVEGRLRSYRLSPISSGDDLLHAWDASKRMLKAASPTVTWPLWLSVFRSASSRTPYSLHLVGTPQAGKSELAALATGHFGVGLTPKNALASWEDTDSSLERVLFQAKNVVALVDDFRPNGNAKDSARIQAKADHVLRAAFNGHGRGRLRADTSTRPDYYPRGLILSTGEELPEGKSLQTRVLMLRIDLGSTNWPVVTQLQNDRSEGRLTALLCTFIVWVASRREELLQVMKSEADRLRAEWQSATGRIADIAADLFAIWPVLRQFSLEHNLATPGNLSEMERELRVAEQELVFAQEEHLTNSDPTEQFRDCLRGALQGGRGYLKPATGEAPMEEQQSWMGCNSSGEGKGDCLGYAHFENQEVWLIPKVAYAVASDLARRGGTTLGVSECQLWKRLSEVQALKLQEPGRNTSKRTPHNGNRTPFIVIQMDWLTDDPGQL